MDTAGQLMPHLFDCFASLQSTLYENSLFMGADRENFDSLTVTQRAALTEMITRVEISTLRAFWMDPTRERALIPDAYKICFSMAVDASWDKKYDEARQMVRVGIFLKMTFHDGGNPVRRHSQGNVERDEEHARVLVRTSTDRGLVLFLDALHTCGCLRERAEEMRRLPPMAKCYGCKVQAPKSQLRRCSRCRLAVYCSPECQRACWPVHKRTCMPCQQPAAATTASS